MTAPLLLISVLIFHQGLRVADGSAMPLLVGGNTQFIYLFIISFIYLFKQIKVGGNTQAAIMMIGEKAAAMIIEDAAKLSKAVRTELGRDEL